MLNGHKLRNAFSFGLYSFLFVYSQIRAVGRSENLEGGGASSHVVGITPTPLDRIGLTDLPKSGTGGGGIALS